MKFIAYKLHFTFKPLHHENGVKVEKEYDRVELAKGLNDAIKIATRICRECKTGSCTFSVPKRVRTGRIWKVTMDGEAHLLNSKRELVDREDMHKVLFVDALDMHDAEQIAYRIWERQVAEEGWSDIIIFRTLVDVPKLPMTGKAV